MRLAYLLASYPMTSTTFIRREIEALEALGLEIRRYAVRAWPHPLVDARDLAEQARTHYVLTGNIGGLASAFAREAVRNPRGVLRSLRAWRELRRNAGGGLVRPVAYLLQAAYFRQRAAADRIDHVHVHFGTNATAVAMLARLMGGPSYSFTAHGPDELVDPERLSFRAKIAHASFVVAISDYCRGRLLKLARREDQGKIHIARCGLAMEEFEPAPGGEAESQTFVCVGRLCPQKGQELIPRAVAGLRADFPRLKVVLVGDGEIRGAIEAAIREHGVADQVVLHGWAANEEVRAMIRASRALLLPSFAEGLPVVIMEAFALGRPVISTRVAGIPELLDDSCGWLVPAGDEPALAEAMRQALSCSAAELAAKGAAGRARVASRHDRRDLARTLNRLFRGQEPRECPQPEAVEA